MRFLAAFDKNPTTEQVDGRESEIKEAIAAAENALKGIGPDGSKGDLPGKLTKLKDEFAKARQLQSANDRYRALGALAPKAEDLQSKCEKQEKEFRDKAGAERLAVEDTIRKAIEKAEAIKQVVLEETVAGELGKVKQQFVDATKKKGASDYFKALGKIDLNPLNDLVSQATKSWRFLEVGINSTADAEQRMSRLPDDAKTTKEFTTLETGLTELKKTGATLLNSRGDDLLAQAKKFVGDASKVLNSVMDFADPFRKEIKKQAEEQEKLKELTDPIDSVRRQAEGILASCNVKSVEKELETLRDAAETLEALENDALSNDPFDDKIEALKAIDTRPVVAAIAKVQDAMKGVPRMLGSVAGLVDKLKGKAKDTCGQELKTLTEQFEAAAQQDDPGALDRIKAKLVTLIKDIAKVSKQDEYGLLLEAQFGVAVKRKGVPFPPNLKGTYDMLNAVPDSHVGQSKLNQVVFNYGKVVPYGEYGDSVITMQSKMFDFTGLTFKAYELKYKEPPFVVDGKAYKPNAFNITMLHEIGHSIDDKHDIMDGCMASAASGTGRTKPSKARRRHAWTRSRRRSARTTTRRLRPPPPASPRLSAARRPRRGPTT